MSMRPLRLREASLPLSFAVCGGLSLLALGARADAATLTGNAALTTDYVWRGSTQTQGDPAAQAGFKLASDSGFYASVWGSNVEFAPDTHASSELDLSLGWTGKLAPDWALDLNVLHYRYPATTRDLNWTELNGSLTYADRYWLALGYSNEALGSRDGGLYTQIGARYPINPRLRVEAAAGYYRLQQVYGDSYAHAQLSSVWAIKAPLELRLTAHATDSAAERIFGDDYAGDRIEAALQASF
ncbi:TorF family putative porin [Lysobacter sp. 5GHs7-4]|uniref:TorF family putative porin n=1 Tax=Lysobacter sp. 5GHs7-4 TaxID=2904253 RepID=UPI001E4362DD|nr:TorF family putative porin [Lysobacter sp. 5GHs7-4]UHQ21781.1 TorF family putative porin [Lysobacter sp. 5GHs7-4]